MKANLLEFPQQDLQKMHQTAEESYHYFIGQLPDHEYGSSEFANAYYFASQAYSLRCEIERAINGQSY